MKLTEYNGELQERDEDDPTVFCQLVNIDNKTYWVEEEA